MTGTTTRSGRGTRARPTPPPANGGCSTRRPSSRPKVATTRSRCATSRPAPSVALGTLYRHYTSKDQLLLAALAQQAATLRERLDQRPPRGATAAERVSDVLRRASRALERQPRVIQATLTAMSSPDDDRRAGQARDQRDAPCDHRRRRRRRAARRSRRHHAGARRRLVRRAHLLERRDPPRHLDGRQPGTRRVAPPRPPQLSQTARSERRDRLAEDRGVLGVRRVERAQDRPLRADGRVGAQLRGDALGSARDDTVGQRPALGLGRGVRVVPAEERQATPGHGRVRRDRAHELRPCAKALGRRTPRVPTVGERDDLAHVRGVAADPHRVAATSRGLDRRDERLDARRRCGRTASRTLRSRPATLESPDPMAAISRPPLIRCAVSRAAARAAGGRSVARATSVPMWIVVVSAAIAPRSVKHSSAPRRGGGLSRHRWS